MRQKAEGRRQNGEWESGTICNVEFSRDALADRVNTQSRARKQAAGSTQRAAVYGAPPSSGLSSRPV
jgi:hypothetical protein